MAAEPCKEFSGPGNVTQTRGLPTAFELLTAICKFCRECNASPHPPNNQAPASEDLKIEGPAASGRQQPQQQQPTSKDTDSDGNRVIDLTGDTAWPMQQQVTGAQPTQGFDALPGRSIPTYPVMIAAGILEKRLEYNTKSRVCTKNLRRSQRRV